MKKTRILITLSMLALLMAPLWLAPMPADAGGIDLGEQLQTIGNEAYGEDVGAPDRTQLATTIGKIVNAALGLLGVVLLVLILYGGFLWMTAGGNEDQVSKAKKIITNAVVGLVIIMAAYAIAGFVVEAVSTAT